MSPLRSVNTAHSIGKLRELGGQVILQCFYGGILLLGDGNLEGLGSRVSILVEVADLGGPVRVDLLTSWGWIFRSHGAGPRLPLLYGFMFLK